MNTDIVVMGVAGSGKSSLAAAFARAEALTLIEGDAFHSADSVDKMGRGVALTDADRERLRDASPGLRFAFLEIDRHAALARVNARASEHLFSAGLVDSQFATLESPLDERGVLRLDATQPLAELQQHLSAWWRTQACDQPS